MVKIKKIKDIKNDFDNPVFDKLSNCLLELMKFTDNIPEKDLKQGRYVALKKDGTNEIYYLKFKLKTKLSKKERK